MQRSALTSNITMLLMAPFFYDNPSRMKAYFCFKKQFNLPTSQVLAAHSAMEKRGKVDVDEKRACVCAFVCYMLGSGKGLSLGLQTF